MLHERIIAAGVVLLLTMAAWAMMASAHAAADAPAPASAQNDETRPPADRSRRRSRSAPPEPLDPANLPPEMSLSLEELLTDPADVGGEQTRCLRRRGSVSVEVLDSEHLLFKGLSRRTWLNKLRGTCVGLRPDMVLVMESRGPGLCDKDSVYGTDRSGFGIRSGRCMLGPFEEISREHGELLETAFGQQRGRSVRGERKSKRRRKAEEAGAEAPQPR